MYLTIVWMEARNEKIDGSVEIGIRMASFFSPGVHMFPARLNTPLLLISLALRGEGNGSYVIPVGNTGSKRRERMPAGLLFFQSNHRSSPSAYLVEFRWYWRNARGL